MCYDFQWQCPMCTLITRFMGPTWGPSGADGPRWAPCWPHELCYLGSYSESNLVITVLADVPAPNGAGPSAGITLTTKLDMIFPRFSWLLNFVNVWISYVVLWYFNCSKFGMLYVCERTCMKWVCPNVFGRVIDWYQQGPLYRHGLT